jgi:aconitate hydratase
VVETYAKSQGLWRDLRWTRCSIASWKSIWRRWDRPSPDFIAPPRLSATEAAAAFRKTCGGQRPAPAALHPDRRRDVVIAAITSCTTTSNPRLMIAAGLLARKAVRRGLRSRPGSRRPSPRARQPWRPTSSGPASSRSRRLGFNVVGFGCTTCIGNSGRLAPEIERQIAELGVHVTAVLSGNRNFDGRINPSVASSYLMSAALPSPMRSPLDACRRWKEPSARDRTVGPSSSRRSGRRRHEVEAVGTGRRLDASAFAAGREMLPMARELWQALDHRRRPVRLGPVNPST